MVGLYAKSTADKVVNRYELGTLLGRHGRSARGVSGSCHGQRDTSSNTKRETKMRTNEIKSIRSINNS